jgi:hypothetical protein
LLPAERAARDLVPAQPRSSRKIFLPGLHFCALIFLPPAPIFAAPAAPVRVPGLLGGARACPRLRFADFVLAPKLSVFSLMRLGAAGQISVSGFFFASTIYVSRL